MWKFFVQGRWSCYYCIFECAVRYKWDSLEPQLRPERGLLALRQGLETFANLRPATVIPEVVKLDDWCSQDSRI